MRWCVIGFWCTILTSRVGGAPHTFCAYIDRGFAVGRCGGCRGDCRAAPPRKKAGDEVGRGTASGTLTREDGGAYGLA